MATARVPLSENSHSGLTCRGQVLFSALFLNETITPTQTAGYSFCLAFFGLYNYYTIMKL